MAVKVEAYANATIRTNDEKIDYFDIRVIISGAARDTAIRYAEKWGIENKTELLEVLIYRGLISMASEVGL